MNAIKRTPQERSLNQLKNVDQLKETALYGVFVNVFFEDYFLEYEYNIQHSLNLIAMNLWKKVIAIISCGAKKAVETTFTKIALNNGRNQNVVEK